MPIFRRSIAVVALMAASCVSAQTDTDGTGLKPPASDAVWPRWQARILTSTATPLWRQTPWELGESQGLRLESLSLLGDYYFSPVTPSTRIASGLRATSGLIIGTTTNRVLSAYGQSGAVRYASSVNTPDLASAAGTVPYLGLGFTSSSQRGGWGFSADIGLVALSPSSVVKFGRVFGGTQTLDDVLRDMRLAPLVNVGVSYSF